MSTLAIHGGTPVRTKPFPQWPQWDEHESAKTYLKVLETGDWFRFKGHMVEDFEGRFAALCGSKHAIAVTSGTKALEAAVAALELEPNSEIIVPSYTFVTTATCVTLNGHSVVFADIDPATLNVTVDTLEAARTPRTRAVIPVHFGGCPCDMDAITAWAGEHGIKVIEDCSHAHGTRWDGRHVGTLGDLGTFSFQYSKNMTAGEGGIVLTQSDELIGKLYGRHSYGQRVGREWYDHFVVSSNLRMTEWAGAILLAQLERLEEQTERRLHNARRFDRLVDSISTLAKVGTDDPRASRRAYHLYSHRYLGGIDGVDKRQIVKALEAEGIPTSSGYPRPLYRQPLFTKVKPPVGQGVPFAELKLAHVESVCGEVIWHPQRILLGTDDDMRDIELAFEKVFASADELRRIA